MANTTTSPQWTIREPSAVHTNLSTDVSPSVISYGGELWCAWRDTQTGQPKLASCDSADLLWEERGPLQYATDVITGAPALAGLPAPNIDEPDLFVDIHVVVRNADKGKLSHWMYRESGDPAKQTIKKETFRNPLNMPGDDHNLIAHGNMLYCVSTSRKTGGQSYWAQWSPKTGNWESSRAMPTPACVSRPALISCGGNLFMIGVATPSSPTGKRTLFEYMLDGQTWKPSKSFSLDKLQLPYNGSIAGISACVSVDKLFVSVYYKGPDIKEPMFTTYGLELNHVPTWQGPESSNIFQSLDIPSLTFLNNKIYCFHAYTALKKVWAAEREVSTWGDTQRWMRFLDPSLPITQVNIPGTHDALAAGDWMIRVNCQRMRIAAQLKAGVRYLDIRAGMSRGPVAQPSGPPQTSLVAFHNFCQIAPGILISSVLDECYKFLEQNPTEGLVLQIKRDNGDNNQFLNNLLPLILNRKNMWYSGNKIPTVGELRGKIFLVRRFVYTGPELGPIDVCDASVNWPQNDVGTIETKLCNLRIQDRFSLDPTKTLSPSPTKFGYVGTHLKESQGSKDVKTWFINYASAIVFNGVRSSAKLAVDNNDLDSWAESGVNASLVKFFSDKVNSGTRFGTIVMDWADSPSSLIPSIILSNKQKLVVPVTATTTNPPPQTSSTSPSKGGYQPPQVDPNSTVRHAVRQG